MLNKKSVTDINVTGKKVLVRCDFNVPMKDGVITSDKRIVGALPTIKYLLDNGAAVILCSHMGKPHNVFNDKIKLNKKEKAKIEALPENERDAATAELIEKAKKDVKKLTLAPVAARISELLGKDVIMAKDVVGEDAKAKAAALKSGEVMLLENVRFHAEEEKNDPEFAKQLASLAEIYVNDAFGTAHRAHASTAGVADYLPAVCGFLIQKEIDVMGKALDDPDRPFVAILGGAKVADKLTVIENLLGKVDTLIIGGGMAYTFLAAQGKSIGTSLFDDTKLDYCKEMLAKAEKNGVKLLLPVDTVVWNGPMGVFENPTLAAGTIAVAKALADSGATTIVGGGDSAAAVEQLGFADKITHISTGGGASLEFLEGKQLPGITCLNDK